jgi:hypothetical protein
MTRVFFNRLFAAALCAVALAVPLRARAAFMADPDKLYSDMKAAYDKGNAQGWTFYNQEFYLSTIFNAGRAYSLQRPTDPAYPQIEQATVDVATGVHYDPLINHEAVPWYVREAAVFVERNNTDPAEVAKAKDLLARVDALEDAAALAQFADQDAAANAGHYPHDTNAKLLRVEANWRGWLITHDASWRSLALQRAAQSDFPIGNIPTSWGPGFLHAVQAAAAGEDGYTADDVANAKAIVDRIARVTPLKTIESLVSTPSHERQMTTLAPADEYFGPMQMSILGIRNELNRVNYMIGYGYNVQESGAAVQIAASIDGLHRVYPRDRDLPQLLYDIYTTLTKIDTSEAKTTRAHMRAILTVEYQDSKQAQDLLKS